jgi:hypothetical protein
MLQMMQKKEFFFKNICCALISSFEPIIDDHYRCFQVEFVNLEILMNNNFQIIWILQFQMHFS